METVLNGGSRYVRSVHDVEQVIGHAKLEDKDVRPLTQVLYFDDEFPEYKIIELDREVLECLREEGKLVFRGEKTDKAVLCSKTKTFDVKEAETSNSCLLIPELKFVNDIPAEISERKIEEKKIVGVCHDYLELKQIKPRLLKLKKLLNRKPYKGTEQEEEDQSGEDYFTLEKLLEVVQASEEELKEALIESGAFCLHGNWRIMDYDYHFRVLSQFLGFIESNSWPLDQVPIGECTTELSVIIPKYILDHLFQLYLVPLGDYNDNGDELFMLKENEVCRFLGSCLLQASVGKFNLSDFLRTWQESVPEGMSTSLDQLAGLAVTSPTSRPPVIWVMDEEDLPEDLQERFNALFTAKERWTYDEMAPYIKRFSTEKQSVNAIITKFSRASNVNGVRYYSARHGK